MAKKYQLHGAFPSKAGDSAYEVALKNGFEGTEQEWLNSLVGETGPQGPAGKDAENVDLSGYIEAPEAAAVGQAIVVKEVDENGKPTQWEAADLATVGYETIADFTTTEKVSAFNVPINKTMIEKLQAADSIVVSLTIPRDTEDTETSTVGTITCGVYLTWKYRLCYSVEFAIPAPIEDWTNNGYIRICQNNLQSLMNDIYTANAISGITGRSSSSKNVTFTQVTPWVRHLNPNSSDHYFYIEGSQNMAAGTHFVVEVAK